MTIKCYRTANLNAGNAKAKAATKMNVKHSKTFAVARNLPHAVALLAPALAVKMMHRKTSDIPCFIYQTHQEYLHSTIAEDA